MRLIRLLKNDLLREIQTWADDRLITVEQAEKISARYGIDYYNPSTRSYGYYVLVGLGYLFIGLAVITLIGHNWDDLPRGLRMGGLIALTLAANAFGYFRFRAGEQKAATTWFFLGGLLYGASIMLIAQIYHIGEHFPDGIFWWGIGVLPIAILLDSTLILLLAGTLGFTWFFVESSMNFYPALFPVFLIAIAWHVFRIKQSNLLFLALMVGFGFWGEYTLSWLMTDAPRFRFREENIVFAIGLLLAFHGFSRWLMQSREHRNVDYGTLLSVWTLRLTIIALFIFSFDESWRGLIRAHWHSPSLAVSLAVGCSLVALALVYRAGRPLTSTAVFAAFYIISMLTVMQVDDRKFAVYFQFADNVLLVVAGIWLIVRGIQSKISHYFFLGVLTVLATGLIRYIDFVGDYIGASILFIVFAVILLSAAKFWRRQQATQETGQEGAA
jgi:uncharacterized membrane protein